MALNARSGLHPRIHKLWMLAQFGLDRFLLDPLSQKHERAPMARNGG
jgi:hypothetical protein